MTTTVTTHSTSVRVSKNGTLSTLATGMSMGGSAASMSQQTPASLPSSLISVSGLLNSRNLVQDEKLVVATLATLDSGNVSDLIKQDLKLSIQSRRKAEGKAEIQVEFKKPVKDELTSEELIKRARRRELNRLAARRSREKGQKRKDMLVEEIRKLQSENSELINLLGDLTEERNTIVETLRQHMKQCSDYHATQSAAVGMSQRVLDLLGFPSLTASNPADLPGVSSLYISTGDLSSTPPHSHSPTITVKKEKYPFSSCPSSPLVVGLSGKVIKAEDSLPPIGRKNVNFDDSSSPMLSTMYSLNSPLTSFSTPLASPQLLPFESPPLPLSRSLLLPRRSSTSVEGLDKPTSMPCSIVVEHSDDDEVVPYKHKLMKYRNQSSELNNLSQAGARGVRVGLERSFSFPCTVKESRKGVSSLGMYTEDLAQSDSSIGFQEISTTASASASVDTGSEGESHDSPLDLAIQRRVGNYADSEEEKHYGVISTDTWPPAGSRSAALPRGLERRWSVDDHHVLSQPLPQPLNLSSREMLEEESVIPSQTSTGSSDSSSSPLIRPSSKYSRYAVDPYS